MKPTRLLYVEDETSTAKIVGAQLKQAGYRFDTATCGHDAISLAATNEYDLILLDIMLPDLDGYEVIHRIRRLGIDTPFLIQTGLVDRGMNEDEGMSLGASEYLIKPFNKNELINGIDKVVGRSRQVSDAWLKSIADPALPQRPPATERRKHRRFASMKTAHIVSPQIFEIVLMNMGYGGAAIRLPHPVKGLPNKFTLEIHTGPQLECEVCWRLGDKVGVKFT